MKKGKRKKIEKKNGSKEGCIEVGKRMKNKGNTIRDGKGAWLYRENEWKRRRKECEIGMEEKEKKVYYRRSDQMMNGWRE